MDNPTEATIKPEASQPNPYTISLLPNEILINVVQRLNGRVGDLRIEINRETTCREAIRHVLSLLDDNPNFDYPLWITPIKTPQERQKLREMAKEFAARPLPFSSSTTHKPVSIRNAIPADQLPNPERATLEQRKRLKEMYLGDFSSKVSEGREEGGNADGDGDAKS